RDFQSSAQILRLERLRDEPIRARQFGAQESVLSRESCHENNGNSPTLADPFRGGNPIQPAGQLNIHQHEVRTRVFDPQESLSPSPGHSDDVIAQLLELRLQVHRNDLLVLDYQDFGPCFHGTISNTPVSVVDTCADATRSCPCRGSNPTYHGITPSLR